MTEPVDVTADFAVVLERLAALIAELARNASHQDQRLEVLERYRIETDTMTAQSLTTIQQNMSYLADFVRQRWPKQKPSSGLLN